MGALSREYNTLVDDYGIDPLQDKGLTAVQSVKSFTNYTVTSSEAGRPDLISFKFYDSVELWWAILSYNGITDVRDLTDGVTIRIPDYISIITGLSETSYTQGPSSSVTI